MVEENETVGIDTDKLIDVVGAAIVRDGKVLCARRGNGKSLAGYWEFPGGKVKPGESRREALRREIEEELLCEVTIADEVHIHPALRFRHRATRYVHLPSRIGHTTSDRTSRNPVGTA